MHITILTQYYPPEIGAPQARLSELSRGLVTRGHQVTVLTAMPNYPRGKVYPGYGGLMREEREDGVQIIRSGIVATRKAGMLPRLLNYFSFVISSVIVGAKFLPQADYLLTESPPLFLGLSGYILSRLKKAQWLFNVSDLWPESAVRLGVIGNGLPLKLSEALESFCYRKAWAVTGQSHTILENIHERFPDIRTYHFSNGVDIDKFAPAVQNGNEKVKHLLLATKRGTVALYAGLHGMAQGLDQILLAAQRLKDLPDLEFVFLGDGPEKSALIHMANDLGVDNVRFLDPLPREQMPAVLAAADISLVPLKMYIPGAVPSKLYEAMASAIPVVLIAEGEAAQIVRDNHAGLVVTPGDIEGITNSLRALICDVNLRKQMGDSGRYAAAIYFDRAKIVDQFVDFLD